MSQQDLSHVWSGNFLKTDGHKLMLWLLLSDRLSGLLTAAVTEPATRQKKPWVSVPGLPFHTQPIWHTQNNSQAQVHLQTSRAGHRIRGIQMGKELWPRSTSTIKLISFYFFLKIDTAGLLLISTCVENSEVLCLIRMFRATFFKKNFDNLFYNN